MKTINLVQGSPEWHAHRATHFNASDAPAMMGASKYKTRSQLLNDLKTGITQEVTDFQQALFNRGHAAEAAARPHIESLIVDELYPVVGVCDDDLPLSASFDGINLTEDTIFECKLWNQDLVKAVLANDLPAHYYWQLEHQLLVSGAERAIFAVANDDATEIEWMEYHSIPERQQALKDGWRQFAKDLADYVPEAPKVEAVGRAPDALPALRIEVTGMVTASNLQEFHGHALAVIGSINTELSTDADFADAEQTIKWLKKDVEDRLDAAKQHALSQTASIDDLFRTIDSIREEARQTRLNLDKQVKSRKDAIRIEIQQDGQKALVAHIETINATLDGYRLPEHLSVADFTGAMKGKKTITSLRDAVDGELARAKIEANQVADKMRLNIARLRELASDHKHLFHDAQQLVLKAQDDMEAAIKARIADAETEQKRKAEAEEQRRQAEAERAKQQTESAQAASNEIELETVNGEKTKVPAEKPYAKGRPSDMEILNALANHFGADRATVIGWIEEMKADLASAA